MTDHTRTVDAPAKRKRGRPPGQKVRIAAAQLRHPHFSFVRARIQGIPLRKCWSSYLAFEGGPDDERHFAARLRELVLQIRLAAAERGLGARADIALAGLQSPPAKSDTRASTIASSALAPASIPMPTIPTLDDWVAERCGEWGVEVDFQTQADWLEDYQAEFGIDQAVRQLSAIALPEPLRPPTPAGRTASPAPLNARLEALNALADALTKPPALEDALGAWLSPELATRLAGTRVGGKTLPIVTLGNLIVFVNLYHHRWWTHVPRLGAERAGRLVAWLAPLADTLGQPLKEIAIQPLQRLTLARQNTLDALDPASLRRYGVVPLDRLAVPAELDGRHGDFRATGKKNTFGVETDLEAIFAWLRRHADSPRTSASYGRIVERFYLWCLWVKKKPMSSLDEGDFRDYRTFMAKPPADWVQERRVGRAAAEWRPFKGPLSPASRKLNFTVISALLSALIQAGYLAANAAAGVLPAMKMPHLRINIDRTFDEAQWSWVMQCWRKLYRGCGPTCADGEEERVLPDPEHPDQSFARAAMLRRTRLILEIGATTGLRLIELVTTRRGALLRQVVEGESVWILKVLGKGNKTREVLVFDDIKNMIDQHHRDMGLAATGFDATNHRVRELLNPQAREAFGDSPVAPAGALVALPSPPLPGDSGFDSAPVADEVEEADPDQLPLVGALRKSPPRWKTDANGVAFVDRTAACNSDRYGSLDPTALYQALKRFLTRCGEMAQESDAPIDRAGLGAASTHWLRHFFANSAAADNVTPVALMGAMGHGSLQTTSLYLRAERRLIVSEMSRMRRRS